MAKQQARPNNFLDFAYSISSERIAIQNRFVKLKYFANISLSEYSVCFPVPKMKPITNYFQKNQENQKNSSDCEEEKELNYTFHEIIHKHEHHKERTNDRKV